MIVRRILFPAALLVWALAGLHAQDTGYERDYDYAEQGDDWYGRSARDVNRDYAPTDLELSSSGDDFCFGYELPFDRFGYGPILERTQETHDEYDFRFSFVPSDLSCFSSVPACDDGNPCTSDFWDGAQCQFVAPPVPSEIQGVMLDRASRSTASLAWTAQPAADLYDVYRASSSMLGDLACLVDSVPVPMTDDDGTLPGTGQVFYMLVTGRSCSGESTLGEGRTNGAPCQ